MDAVYLGEEEAIPVAEYPSYEAEPEKDDFSRICYEDDGVQDEIDSLFEG